MLNKFPDSYSHHILQTCNLNDFLNTNIAFDSITTDRLKDNLLQRIALSDGIVQAGERIVDRGEIITPQTYRILKSLETVTLKKSVGNDHRGYTILGQIIVFTCLFSFFYLFLALFRPPPPPPPPPATGPSAAVTRAAYPRLYDDAHRGHLPDSFFPF